MTPESLRSSWIDLRAREPHLRTVDAARLLGVREGQLVAACCGATEPLAARRLVDEPARLLGQLAGVGVVKTITRNPQAVLEVEGRYKPVEFFGHMGQVVGEIDLRIFLARWRSAFEVTEATSRGPRRSLQFFDPHGLAIHKVYSLAETDQEAWKSLVDQAISPDQSPQLEVSSPTTTPEQPDAEIDTEGLRTAWRAMTDTHEFFGLLRRFGVTRTQSFRLVGPEFAIPVPVASFEAILRAASASEVPIMIFVSNPGLVQIYTGPVRKVVTMGPWLNIMDPQLNLHVLPGEITDAWIVRKPTADGPVTALEFYAASELVAQLFGQRKPGSPEDERWRALLAPLAGPGRLFLSPLPPPAGLYAARHEGPFTRRRAGARLRGAERAGSQRPHGGLPR